MTTEAHEHPWILIEAMLGDVKRAMELSDRTLGGLVQRQIERGATRILPRESGARTVGVMVPYVVPFTERWGAP